jgi:hypothetical protein
MKEVASQSKWVGKTITCKKCLRSYVIEAGDRLYDGKHNQDWASFDSHFELPCGHNYIIKLTDKPEDFK